MAQNKSNRACAVPDEIAATGGLRHLDAKRKRIEQSLARAKFVARSRVMVRGIKKVDQVFATAAYNPIKRMRSLGQLRLAVA